VKLRKVRSRGSSYLSAQWQPEGMPGLVIRRSWDMRQSPPPVMWEIGLAYNPEDKPLSSREAEIHQALQDQKFRTREETLRAVQIFLDVAGL